MASSASQKIAMAAMEEGDIILDSSAKVTLDSQECFWHDKHRPRKPKYLNHVRTGYEWNKYNRTHYDRENPPPKNGARTQIQHLLPKP